MSSPAVDSGTSRPPDAVEAIRKRLRPTGAAMLLDGRMVGETRPWGPIVSICPDTKNAPPEGGAERLRNTPCPEKLPRTANRLLRSPRRQTKLSSTEPPSSRKALLQRAARPNFFPSRRNTLSQTLQPFGTRCQPCRCLRSSPVPSVVSATESNPTQSVSPSSFLPPRCHPMVSMRRFPI